MRVLLAANRHKKFYTGRLCRVYNITLKSLKQWWFCYNKKLDPDLLLVLHQFHEVLRSWWKGGAHLLHHGLHSLKVNAWVYTRPTLSVLEHLQSHTHMSDSHRWAATEREQLYRDTTPMLSRQRSVCVCDESLHITSSFPYLHLTGCNRLFQHQMIPVEMPLIFRTDQKQKAKKQVIVNGL